MRVHHLAFRTDDVARLAAFYVQVVGLPEVHAPRAGVVWLAAGDTRVMIEPRGEDEPSVPAGGMDLVAFTIDPEDRAVLVSRLADAGVEIEGETGFSLYFRDPDGRRVGVSHYPLGVLRSV